VAVPAGVAGIGRNPEKYGRYRFSRDEIGELKKD
jgi:hypothetical protein